jgi:rubrerythrin
MDDVLDFAIQMELDGRMFYLKGAESTEDEALKKIFRKLADEEYRHYHIFKKLKDGDTAGAVAEMKNGAPSLSETQTLFKEMTDAGIDTLAGDTEREIWAEARAVEEKTVKLYAEEAEKTSDPERKRLLEMLADEERSHVYLIENILGFLKDPEGFAASRNYASFMSWEGRQGPEW